MEYETIKKFLEAVLIAVITAPISALTGSVGIVVGVGVVAFLAGYFLLSPAPKKFSFRDIEGLVIPDEDPQIKLDNSFSNFLTKFSYYLWTKNDIEIKKMEMKAVDNDYPYPDREEIKCEYKGEVKERTPLSVKAGETVTILHNATFRTEGYARDQEYGRYSLILTVSSAEWEGVKTIKLLGKLGRGRSVEVENISVDGKPELPTTAKNYNRILESVRSIFKNRKQAA